jgi:methionyl-tRNA formyltransferase
MRIAFMGTPDFAATCLSALAEAGHEIALVYSQPPAPRGRGQVLTPSAVHARAEALGLVLRTPVSMRDPDEIAFLRTLGLDALVVVAFGQILPAAVLETPWLGSYNLHASLLPRWRGAAPIQRAIMAGDSETGVMVMRMEEGLDTGPVLVAERTRIGRKTYGELHDELARLGADLMARALAALERGSIAETPQSAESVTYAKKISKDEARIDWTKSARDIDCLIRGLSPVPGAWCEAKGERLKILYAEPVEGRGPPGTLLDDSLSVACGEGALRLIRLQRAGKSVMSAEELLRGFSLPHGAKIG